MKKIISIASLLVALGSSVFVGMTISGNIEPQSFGSPSTSIYEANSNFDLNSATTDNVYQQIVVAGWGIKDMTEVVAAELSTLRSRTEAIADQQSIVTTMLSVAVLLLAVMTALMATGNLSRGHQRVDSRASTEGAAHEMNLGDAKSSGPTSSHMSEGA